MTDKKEDKNPKIEKLEDDDLDDAQGGFMISGAFKKMTTKTTQLPEGGADLNMAFEEIEVNYDEKKDVEKVGALRRRPGRIGPV